VGRKLELLGSEEKAKAAARQTLLQNALSQAQEISARYGGQIDQAKAQQLVGQLQERIALEGAKLNKFERPAGATGGAAGIPGGAANGAGGIIHVPIGEQAQLITLPDGRRAHIGDAKLGDKLNEMSSRTQVIHDLADRATALTQHRLAHVPGTSEYNELKQLRTDLSQTLIVQHGAAKGIGAMRGEEGAISGREIEGARGALANEGLWGHAAGVLSPGREVAAVRSAVKTADNLYDQTLRFANPRIVTGGRPVQGKGGSAYEYQLTGETYAPKPRMPGGLHVGSFKPIGAP
jgi:hypothetical protein